jgi:hypothetical protein
MPSFSDIYNDFQKMTLSGLSFDKALDNAINNRFELSNNDEQTT